MHFNNLGVFESKEAFIQPEIWYNEIDTGGQRTIIPVGAENTIKLDLGENKIYPVNGDFRLDKGWTKTPAFDNSKTNRIPTDYTVNGAVNDYYEDSREWLQINSTQKRIEYWNGEADVKGIDYRWNHMTSDSFKVVTNDGKRMSFDLSIKGIAKPNTFIAIMVLMEFEDQPNRLFSLNPDGFFYDVSYLKLNQPDLQNVERLLMFKFDSKYNNSLVASEQELKLTVNAAAGQNQGDLDLNKAYFTVRVYPNLYDESITPFFTSSIIKDIAIDFKMPNGSPKTVIYQTTVEGNFTKKMEANTVMFGDYIEFGKNGWFYQYRKDSNSIMYNSNGDLTLNWSTINDSSKEPLLLHSLRQKTKAIGRATNEYRIQFDIDSIDVSAIYRVRCTAEKRILVNNSNDELTENDGTFITANNGKYLNLERYIFVGGSIDYMRQEADMILIQCQDKEVETKEYIYTDFK